MYLSIRAKAAKGHRNFAIFGEEIPKKSGR
jgi:uncharacterized protein (DUF342 family)